MEAKDLTKVAPRSAKEIMGGYAILARAIDKCRANIAGTANGYNFDCPMDSKLFEFKGIDGEAFKVKAAEGASDADLLAFINENCTPRTDEEIAEWSAKVMKTDYHHHQDAGKKAWFDGVCARLGMDPEKTYLFDYLDEDDRVSY